MRYISLLFVLLFASQVNAQEIELDFERTCVYTLNKNEQCSEPKWKRTLKSRGKTWFWINAERGDIPLKLIKNDANILVLEGPLNLTHSAVELLHLSKKTGKFYWSEIGYSESLSEDHVSIHFGKFKIMNDSH